jgi:hypothetical protein
MLRGCAPRNRRTRPTGRGSCASLPALPAAPRGWLNRCPALSCGRESPSGLANGSQIEIVKPLSLLAHARRAARPQGQGCFMKAGTGVLRMCAGARDGELPVGTGIAWPNQRPQPSAGRISASSPAHVLADLQCKRVQPPPRPACERVDSATLQVPASHESA